MKVKLEPGAFLPTRAHLEDAGWDLRAYQSGGIPPNSGRTFRTGVHVEIPRGHCGLLVSKSGLNVKNDLTSTGLIDEGYTGEILVKLYNHSSWPYMVSQGDKISQLVILPVNHEPIELVEEISGGERGDDGFGSSGR